VPTHRHVPDFRHEKLASSQPAPPNSHDFQMFLNSSDWPPSCEPQSMNYFMHDGPAAFRFELAGTLDDGDAVRLEKDWRTASSTIGDRTLIIDLSFVTAIDEAGRSLFRRWHASGAQFAAKSQHSRKLVEIITGRPFSAQQQQQPTYEPWLSRSLRSLPMTLLPLIILLTSSLIFSAGGL
jgi:hypothetical protein